MTVSICIIFIIGYCLIAFESFFKINKAAIALVSGVLCWTLLAFFSPDNSFVPDALSSHIAQIAGILFFLLGAMTIVELIDAHDGFDIITNQITNNDKRKLLWLVAFITFFLSALLDNLTTAIVIITLLRKLIRNENDRLFFAGIVIVAANAGGAWSPIGDVTTTMLWIGGQISPLNIILKLFLPSLVCLLTPLIFLSFTLKGNIQRPLASELKTASPVSGMHQQIIFFSGILILFLVPVFKSLTHLPPFMGILIGLGLLWITTEILHIKKNEQHKIIFSVPQALRKIDTPSILFFLGILLAVDALQTAGILASLAAWLSQNLHSINNIAISFGLLSSIIDNVPLLAASQNMFSLAQYPIDNYLWEFLAYATGTGGSVLVIGSAAGVAAMGLENITFAWYLRKITPLALLGYFAGAFVFIIQHFIFNS